MTLHDLLARSDLSREISQVIEEELKERAVLENKIVDLENKLISKQLELDETSLLALLNASPESSVLLDLDGIILAINRVAAQRIGKSPSYLIGRNIFDYFSPEIAKFRKNQCQTVINSKQPIQFVDSRKKRRFDTFMVPMVSTKSQIVYGVAIFATDVTDRYEANIQLLESEEKYRTLIERSKDGILIIQDGVVKFLNTSLAEMYGAPVESIVNTPFTKYIHPNSMDMIKDYSIRRKRGEEVPSIYEATLISKDGIPVSVEINSGSIQFQNSPALIVTIRDLSKRKFVELKLRENERLLRQIIDLVPHQIFAKDIDGKLILVNKTVARAYNRKVEELEGSFHQQVHPHENEVARFLVEDQEVLTNNTPKFIPEQTFTDTEGQEYILQTTKIPFKFGDKRKDAVLGVAVDISELKKKENHIMRVKLEEEHYQNMLNHFVNNYLQKIVSNIEWLEYEFNNEGTYNKSTSSEIIELAKQSSLTIEKVTKIFEIIKKTYTSNLGKKKNVLNIFQQSLDQIKKTERKDIHIVLDSISKDLIIRTDEYIHVAFHEVLSFIVTGSSYQNLPLIGRCTTDNLSIDIILEDPNSKPISNEITRLITSRITDHWEWQGHFIGLALAANIMNYLGGEFVIEPQNVGNRFIFRFHNQSQ